MSTRNVHYITLNTREKLIWEQSHEMCSQSMRNLAKFNYQTCNHGNIFHGLLATQLRHSQRFSDEEPRVRAWYVHACLCAKLIELAYWLS